MMSKLGTHFIRPPRAIPTEVDEAIVAAKASDPARFGRIDRRIRGLSSGLDAL